MPWDSRKVTVDSSRWPVVVITQIADQLTDAERAESLLAADAVIDSRPGRYAVVLDNRLAGPVSPTQRALIAEYGRRTAERVRTRCVCNAMVMKTEIMRAMVTAIQWQTGKLVETELFDDLDLAIRWARTRLDAAAVGF